jgi:hypothetical protein
LVYPDLFSPVFIKVFKSEQKVFVSDTMFTKQAAHILNCIKGFDMKAKGKKGVKSLIDI